ncbi:TetR/AcrR family transcriptional regulator [Alkalicaulis satelles]|uniref:TetR/AcrR family transcriptional regulator n=1 Tax=Alkalicaulis satelles TaxID=2609175 RepID=A0A5M6ZKS3_9PROT|nr:TetR/AcrR family transcriptional regulator [Alkalicaulis satelles]KAA5803818.1 TetR/AcrR family transcriptional regulator [Alkalicaulis satelles]
MEIAQPDPAQDASTGGAPARDRAATEARLIEAARAVLIEKGFQGLGVNAVARAAGCDKQLIYRYFGGLDGLGRALGEAFSASLTAALDARAPDGAAQSYGALIEALVLAYLDVFAADREAQRLVLWELSEPGPALQGLAKARARALAGWIARRRGRLEPPDGVDAPAVNALLIAAVHQIVLARAASGALAGVQLDDDEGWRRARAALGALARMALSAP